MIIESPAWRSAHVENRAQGGGNVREAALAEATPHFSRSDFRELGENLTANQSLTARGVIHMATSLLVRELKRYGKSLWGEGKQNDAHSEGRTRVQLTIKIWRTLPSTARSDCPVAGMSTSVDFGSCQIAVAQPE